MTQQQIMTDARDVLQHVLVPIALTRLRANEQDGAVSVVQHLDTLLVHIEHVSPQGELLLRVAGALALGPRLRVPGTRIECVRGGAVANAEDGR